MASIVSTPLLSERQPELLYLQSSQARHWRFSARQIEKMRSDGNEAAQRRVNDLWTKERSLNAVDGEPESSSSSAPLAFLSVDEEQLLIAYYLTRVRQLVKAFGLPEAVEATTITYIKRFYLRNSCLDDHPKNIMLTCLFLAAKAENYAVPLRHFATKLAGKDPSSEAVNEYVKTVQDLEFFVSQSLSFEYTVHGAHRALHGAFLDVQSLSPKPSQETLADILTSARAELQKSRFSDVELLYTPSQIALTCMYNVSDDASGIVRRLLDDKQRRAMEGRTKMSAEREAWRTAERARLERKGITGDKMQSYVQQVHVNEAVADAALGMSTAEIVDLFREIGQMINEQSSRATDNVDTVREVDKKLKACQNPEKLNNSRLTRKREEERSASEKTTTTGQQQLGKRAANGQSANGAPGGDDDDDADDVDAVESTRGSKRIKRNGS